MHLLVLLSLLVISRHFHFCLFLFVYLFNLKVWKEKEQIRQHGCTLKQKALAIKLQALWRGYLIRSYYLVVEKAMGISSTAGEKYMNDPDSEINLYNYMLFCHVVLNDYSRARDLYTKALQRMEYRGPDIAFVLYAYIIFAFVSHEEDHSDILILRDRARKAEEVRENMRRKRLGMVTSRSIERGTYKHGKVFDLAATGFFRHQAETNGDNFLNA